MAFLAAPQQVRGCCLSNFAAVREPPFPLTPSASARVELALAGAFRRHDTAIVELRSAIEACVRELQQQGMLPEAMVVTMRAFMQHTASHPSAAHPVAARVATLLLDQIIHWSILAYYPATILPIRPPRGSLGEGS
jgi:hypothetical protein